MVTKSWPPYYLSSTSWSSYSSSSYVSMWTQAPRLSPRYLRMNSRKHTPQHFRPTSSPLLQRQAKKGSFIAVSSSELAQLLSHLTACSRPTSIPDARESRFCAAQQREELKALCGMPALSTLRISQAKYPPAPCNMWANLCSLGTPIKRGRDRCRSSP